MTEEAEIALAPIDFAVRDATPALVQRVLGARVSELRGHFDRVYSALYPLTAALGIVPNGPALAITTRMAGNELDIEIGVPVSQADAGRLESGLLPADSGFVLSQIPAGPSATTIYTGGYGQLGRAWGEFMRRIAEAGRTPAGPSWESYLTEPTPGGDPAKNQTELGAVLAEAAPAEE